MGDVTYDCRTSISFFDFTDSCTRALWISTLPAALVVLICIFSVRLPLPGPLRNAVEAAKAPFRAFLTLDEAEALIGDDRGDIEGDVNVEEKAEAPPWKTSTIVIVGLLQALFNAVFAVMIYITNGISSSPHSITHYFFLLLSMSWLYTSARGMLKPFSTAPLDLFAVYLVLFAGTLMHIGGVLYEYQVHNNKIERFAIVVIGAQFASIILVLGVVLSMPLAVPSPRLKKEIGKTVSTEDYTSLWGWITFSWVKPLVDKGRNTTLNEDDVWNLSPTMQSKPVFIKFAETARPTLLRQLWASNSFDLILDISLTHVSIAFTYAGPFFLKRILDTIDLPTPTPESKMRAYVYAFLAFACALLTSQADVHHLWFCRRVATRIRTELMAAIYDKALKRRDYSGVVDKGKVGKEEEAERGADEPKAGADVGKIVNLMSGDANRVYLYFLVISIMVSSLYFIYGAPFEILIAGFYLYQLLGISAFAGIIVLIVGYPLNSYATRRSVRIQKGFLTARDKRMSVVSELISAVKFIKFFAWEEKWIQRVLDAREVEMSWMVKGRVNMVLFSFIWSCAPILVSIVSFFTYVMLGNELTVSVAFTAIMLFGMIRVPLNYIPHWYVQILQTGLAIKRITVYLDEDEVDGQVCSLKDLFVPDLPGEEQGLGLRNATLKWNEVPEAKEDDKDKKDKGKQPALSPLVSGDGESVTTTAIGDVDLLADGGPGDHRFELKDIDILFPEGELTVITGPTASGKTALLMALLGEMTLTQGKLIMSKNPSSVDENGYMRGISYVAQSPWLRHQSIKDNILFGYPYDDERYNAVVEACALGPDLEMLEDGDETEIGVRGVSLSGGQKARVALARAVYARTRYVLLDDPLSAVDSHTSRLLYEKLLRGPLLARRTVILVTHHVELVLPGAYYLVRMLDGRIDTQGIVAELRAKGVLDDIAHDAEVEAQKEEVEKEVAAVEETGNLPVDTKKPRKLVQDEHRETGGVKWSIYKRYLEASSYWIWAFLFSLVVFSQFLGVAEKFWIKIWGDAYPKEDGPASMYTFGSFSTPEHGISTERYFNHHHYQRVLSRLATAKGSLFGIELPSATEYPLFYVSIYAAIGLSGALVSMFSVIAQYTGALRASRKQLLLTVVRATFRFHDTTPQGRMMNRFGKDIETIDSSLAGSLQAVNSSLAGFFAAILTVAVVFPYFLIPAFFIGLAYRELAIGYLNTGRDLRRMESNSRSPIFSDFGELLEGIVTVRAFSAERRFLNNLHLKIDNTTKMWYSFWMTNRWLLLNFDALGALGVLITTLFSVSTLSNSAGLAGVCITSAMAFTTSVYWACRQWTTLELDLNLDLPQEPPAIIESNRTPAYWPSSSNNGTLISIENLVVRYAPELPAVLQDVSFTLKAGERVGLLGRTGEYRDTLPTTCGVDPTSGRIVIDGIDISTIGIHDLRSRLTFIPQDATLFSGTLRDNLDPFGEHEDSDCLDVLYRVHLINRSANASERHSASSSRAVSRAASVTGVDHESTIETTSSTTTEVDTKTTLGLDTQVSGGGTNFSQGQRQLIAMARALLRRSSIIVLDEATSSIDFATDAKIQTAIREEFTESLLLTVAHRLHTVIDYDRLIVLDKGRIAELDTPWNLIRKEDGIFRTMCLKSGQYGELEAAAKAKAERDQLER
ncbi:multidrug resistance-associated ABC transporter [Cyathus striatus]|nr:multidrug resistance-associated ABC transporter [Cyathus striatus]